MPIGQDRGAGPECQDGHAVAGRLERPVGAARPLREDEQDVALLEDALGQPECLDVGGVTIDRVHTAVAGDPADDRPIEELLLAEPVHPPAERRRQPGPEDDRIEVRGVVGGDDQRPVARDLVESPLRCGSASSPGRRCRAPNA